MYYLLVFVIVFVFVFVIIIEGPKDLGVPAHFEK